MKNPQWQYLNLTHLRTATKSVDDHLMTRSFRFANGVAVLSGLKEVLGHFHCPEHIRDAL